MDPSFPEFPADFFSQSYMEPPMHGRHFSPMHASCVWRSIKLPGDRLHDQPRTKLIKLKVACTKASIGPLLQLQPELQVELLGAGPIAPAAHHPVVLLLWRRLPQPVSRRVPDVVRVQRRRRRRRRASRCSAAVRQEAVVVVHDAPAVVVRRRLLETAVVLEKRTREIWEHLI